MFLSSSRIVVRCSFSHFPFFPFLFIPPPPTPPPSPSPRPTPHPPTPPPIPTPPPPHSFLVFVFFHRVEGCECLYGKTGDSHVLCVITVLRFGSKEEREKPCYSSIVLSIQQCQFLRTKRERKHGYANDFDQQLKQHRINLSRTFYTNETDIDIYIYIYIERVNKNPERRPWVGNLGMIFILLWLFFLVVCL